jgi:hypothetical protein
MDSVLKKLSVQEKSLLIKILEGKPSNAYLELKKHPNLSDHVRHLLSTVLEAVQSLWMDYYMRRYPSDYHNLKRMLPSAIHPFTDESHHLVAEGSWGVFKPAFALIWSDTSSEQEQDEGYRLLAEAVWKYLDNVSCRVRRGSCFSSQSKLRAASAQMGGRHDGTGLRTAESLHHHHRPLRTRACALADQRATLHVRGLGL